jgi:hypothetical protein
MMSPRTFFAIIVHDAVGDVEVPGLRVLLSEEAPEDIRIIAVAVCAVRLRLACPLERHQRA